MADGAHVFDSTYLENPRPCKEGTLKALGDQAVDVLAVKLKHGLEVIAAGA